MRLGEAKVARSHRAEYWGGDSDTEEDFKRSAEEAPEFIFLSELTIWHYSDYFCIYL